MTHSSPENADTAIEPTKAETIPWKDDKRQFPLYELAPDFTLLDRDPQADERLKLYRDIFAEITAKAIPICDPNSDDPDRVRGYRLPVGPLHRAAGKLGFQLFDGERHLANAIKEIERLQSLIRAQQMPVGHAFRSVDGLDWKHLYSFIPDSGHGKFWKSVFDEVRAALTSPIQQRPGLMEGAGSTPASDLSDQSLVEEGGSIPPLAATAQASVNLDLLDACKCAAEWLSGWASAEPYMSQLETAIARASALTSPDASHD